MKPITFFSQLEDNFILMCSIEKISLEVEMSYNDVEERCRFVDQKSSLQMKLILVFFRTLEMYGIEGSLEIMQKAESLPDKWSELYIKAKDTGFRLEKVRKRLVKHLFGRLTSHLGRVNRVVKSFHYGGYYGRNYLPLEIGFESLQFYIDKVKRLSQTGFFIKHQQKLLKLPISMFLCLLKLQSEIENNKCILDIYNDFQEKRTALKTTFVKKFNFSFHKQELHKLGADIDCIHVSHFGFAILEKLKKEITNTISCLLELNKILENEISQHHWLKFVSFFSVKGQGKNTVTDLYVSYFLSIGALEIGNNVTQILKDVNEERRIKLYLNQIGDKWDEAKIVLEKWTHGNDQNKLTVLFFSNTREHISNLAKDCNELDKMTNKGVFFVEKHIKLRKTLQKIFNCLQLWESVQTDCITLVRVFVRSGNILGFEEDLKKYTKMMNETLKKPSVKSCCSSLRTFKELKSFSFAFKNYMNKCQNLVKQIRFIIPRLKLLSFTDVLVILGGWEPSTSSNEKNFFIKAVVKLFGLGIASLQTKFSNISGIESIHNECLSLIEQVSYKNDSKIEKFLKDVFNESEISLQEHIGKTLSIKSKQLGNMMHNVKKASKNFDQVYFVYHEVMFTTDIHICLQSNNPCKIIKEYLQNIIVFVKQFQCNPIEETFLAKRKSLNAFNLFLNKKTILCLFCNEMLEKSNDYMWTSKLRTYWNEKTKNICVKQGLACISYAFSVQPMPIVFQNTPSLERATMAMVTAFYKNMSIFLYGNYGTGKKSALHFLVSTLLNYLNQTNFFFRHLGWENKELLWFQGGGILYSC